MLHPRHITASCIQKLKGTTEEIIDLTTDEPPKEFKMVVDFPSDEEDGEIVVKDEPGNDYRDEDECGWLR